MIFSIKGDVMDTLLFFILILGGSCEMVKGDVKGTRIFKQNINKKGKLWNKHRHAT